MLKGDERDVLHTMMKITGLRDVDMYGFRPSRRIFFSHLLMTLPTATRLRLTAIIQLWRVTCTSSGVYRDHGGAVISFSCTWPCKTAIGNRNGKA